MIQLTPEQVKGRIKSLAKQNNADARVLIRIYMMERFLERVALSAYRDSFIIKGGMLITAMVGVAQRSTMDIDTSIKNYTLSKEYARSIVEEITAIDLDDGVIFEIKDVSDIMEDRTYPGIRLSVDAVMGNMVTPIKVDISTGDVITPHAVEFEYKLLLDDRSIKLWSYNLETILAEKLQTILSRGILNTRMRDYYDIYMLWNLYHTTISTDTLCQAFEATCRKRNTETLKDNRRSIVSNIKNDVQLKKLWSEYQKKYTYASGIKYNDIIESVKRSLEMIE